MANSRSNERIEIGSYIPKLGILPHRGCHVVFVMHCVLVLVAILRRCDDWLGRFLDV